MLLRQSHRVGMTDHQSSGKASTRRGYRRAPPAQAPLPGNGPVGHRVQQRGSMPPDRTGHPTVRQAAATSYGDGRTSPMVVQMPSTLQSSPGPSRPRRRTTSAAPSDAHVHRAGPSSQGASPQQPHPLVLPDTVRRPDARSRRHRGGRRPPRRLLATAADGRRARSDSPSSPSSVTRHPIGRSSTRVGRTIMSAASSPRCSWGWATRGG